MPPTFLMFSECALRVLIVLALQVLLLTKLAADEIATGQNPDYVVMHWSVQDGLPSARINDVVQTQDGYIWLATLNGLARFDGLQFQRFFETETPGLASRLISCLLEDSSGRLWYGTEMGQIGWKDASGFHSLKLPENEMRGRVERLVQTVDGTVWALSRTALLPIKETVAGIPRKTEAGKTRMWDIKSAKDGTLWLLNEGGNIQRVLVKALKLGRTIPDSINGGWRNIASSQTKGIWVLVHDHLRRSDGAQWVEDRYPVPLTPSADSVLRENTDGTVAIGTYGQGLILVDSASQTHRLNHSDGLSSDQVLSLCEDREMNLWVGTAQGLNRITPRVVKTVKSVDNWFNRTVTSVSTAANINVWVGTEGAGIFQVDSSGNVLRHQLSGRWPLDYIRCALEDRAGRVWMGLFGQGLRILDETHTNGMNIAAAANRTINALFEDSRSNMWLGTASGAITINPDNWRLSEMVLTNHGVRCFAEATNGAIWVGLENGGLFRYERGISTSVSPPTSLKLNAINALHVTEDDTLWIGTLGNGLLRFKQGNWLHFGSADGLPSVSISAIQSDAPGNLWVGTSHGLFEISHTSLQQLSFDQTKTINIVQLGLNDGLESLEIPGGRQPASCKTSDGRLWFVSGGGLAQLNPKAIKVNVVKPPVQIQQLMCDGEPLFSDLPPRDSTGQGHSIICPPGARQIEIRYTALSLTAPDQVRFRYRLLGQDGAWVEAGVSRAAYFTHIPPGKYTFQVIACNNQGMWNEEGAALQFSVLAAFWQTIWFKLLLGGLLVAGLILAHRIRTGRLRALELLRHRIARDLHDEVGSNLGSIALLAEVSGKNPRPGDLARIRRTAEDTVDTLRDLVWIINPAHERFSDLATRLHQIAAIMLENMPYKFRDNQPAGDLNLPMELRRNTPPMFKEVLHNIRKHSHARQVNIRMTCQDGNLILEINDDGVGFDSSALRPGNGLKNLQSRATEMQANLTVRSVPGGGTTVTLVAPSTKTRGWRIPPK